LDHLGHGAPGLECQRYPLHVGEADAEKYELGDGCRAPWADYPFWACGLHLLEPRLPAAFVNRAPQESLSQVARLGGAHLATTRGARRFPTARADGNNDAAFVEDYPVGWSNLNIR
jgi:hypothetical protein